MIKILFVCHGNICRSPMAEFAMKKLVLEAGREDEFEIASAATSSEELGNPVYPPVEKLLSSYGIDCSSKRARKLTKNDYATYDYIIGMDEENMMNMRYLFSPDPDKKLYRLLDFAHADRDVSDPWYTRDFNQAWSDIQKGCKALLEYLS